MANSPNKKYPHHSSHPKDNSNAQTPPKKPYYEPIFNDSDLELAVLKKRYKTLNRTIDSLYNELKQYIIGQDDAIKKLTFIVYNNLYLNMLEDTCGIYAEHINGLVIGPSGCGKSATLERLAKMFKIPYTHYNCTGITAAGYTGDDVESIIRYHVSRCGDDLQAAERGIIFIDEIDKKVSTTASNTSGRDINGTSVQQELLKLLEPNVITFGKDKTPFDTHMLTVICGGKFEGLDDIRNERLYGKKTVGFENTKKQNKSYDYGEDDAVARYFDDQFSTDFIPDDLIKYGFIDEFVGRFSMYAEFKKLSQSMVEDILYSKDSILQQYLGVFNSRGVDLIVDQSIFSELAFSVANSNIGARDIKRKIINLLLPALYDTEQNYCPGICEIDENLKYTSIFQKRDSKALNLNVVTEFANRTDLKSNHN